MTETPAAFGRRTFLIAATAVTVAGAAGAADPAGANPARRRQPATTSSRSVGAYEVIPLLDAAGPFFLDRQLAFPAATPQDWERAREIDPGAFGPGQTWQLDFRCFAVRGPRDRLMLVDTGVGPDGSPAGGWAPTPGHLPVELTRAGIDPADVDTVVLTHLHEDHFGWSVGLDGTPFFPNARYVVQRSEVAALAAGDAALSYVVDPLRAAGQLDQVDGSARLACAPGRSGGVRVVPTPGHTPGHQSVVVEDGHRQVIVTGDVLVHAVQLVDPSVAYRYEADPEIARQTRERLLAEARARRAVLATAHLTEPWTEAR
ncbi:MULTISPECIES: MBL fold metallo-hydrolase [Micromonospora]|uniref:MBL fold metallo-hydrolase n=1 Tax=Micromonospora solifontis TaxID=2487138 RepID=A0ABX9WFS5_9ACTN|nr:MULTISPECIES: MBL fold metallo-hydrolase [Micromonospora]NES13841.1 MBL fold metallo-hydrolase [Micromonospora sp. PPF5-17B]NES37067.1 MBL fold metallo-hydrolase [Micromonospora solifontis]NES58328.1 MBL fold metallo-hydrolase [Micromonospora sp. PPF5-6]RNL98737.1 MBL fold metallo-hydrolase [Micromonospora solifontis]